MSRLIAFVALSFLASTTMAKNPEEIVDYVNTAFKDLYNAGDIESLVKMLFHEDAVVTTSTFARYQGHAQISAALKTAASSDPITDPITKVDIKYVTGNGLPYVEAGVAMEFNNQKEGLYFKQKIREGKIESMYVSLYGYIPK